MSFQYQVNEDNDTVTELELDPNYDYEGRRYVNQQISKFRMINTDIKQIRLEFIN